MEQNQQSQEEIIEQLSESLALKLAKKLRERQINVEQMTKATQTFSYLINQEKDIKKIKDFVGNF